MIYLVLNREEAARLTLEKVGDREVLYRSKLFLIAGKLSILQR